MQTSTQEASDPKTSAERLGVLAESKRRDVMAAIAKNPNTSRELLFSLAERFPEEVLLNPVFSLLLLESPDLALPKMIRESLTRAREIEDLFLALSEKEGPAQARKMVASEYIKQRAALELGDFLTLSVLQKMKKYEALVEEILCHIAQLNERATRIFMARYHALPELARQKLSQDSDEQVRAAIQRRSHPPKEKGPPLSLRCAMKTDVGLKRNYNEDDLLRLQEGSRSLFMVADGMGGQSTGDTASRLARDVFARCILEDGSPEMILHGGCLETHLQIKAAWDGRYTGGTTIVAALIEGSLATIANCGNSRAYLWRGSQLTQITKDHSLLEEYRDRLSPQELQNFPHRNILIRSLGISYTISVPDIFMVDLRPGDQLLLCSDGLHDDVSDGLIYQALASQQDVEEKVQALLALAKEAGGNDNISIILIDACQYDAQR